MRSATRGPKTSATCSTRWSGFCSMGSASPPRGALLLAAGAALLAALPVSDVTFDGYHLPKEVALAACAAVLVLAGFSVADSISRLAWGFAALSAASAVAALN